MTGGCGSVSATGTITVNALPSVTANATTFNSVCAGPTAAESATPTITLTPNPATAVANWSLYAGTTATGVPIQTGTGNPNYAFTNSTCNNQSYVYQITPTLNGCNGAPLIINITVLPKPLSTFTITPNPICVGQSATLTYTSPTCPTSVFNWEAEVGSPLAWTPLASSGLNSVGSGIGPITITPNAPGTYRIRVQSRIAAGCQGPMSPALTLIVNPLSAAAGTITGTATVCQGQNSVTYSVPAIANATDYIWTLPSGASIIEGSNTNSITVNYSTAATSGNITVQGTNACGSGTVSANFAVTVKPLPSASFTSPMQYRCPGVNYTANITGTPGASVSISVNGTAITPGATIPAAGTVGINIGTLSVNTTITITSVSLNGCTVNSSPTGWIQDVLMITPSVSGPSTICAGQTAVITFTGAPNSVVFYTFNGTAGPAGVTLDASGTGTLPPATLNVTTTYAITLVTNTGTCNYSGATHTVMVNPINTVGAASATPTVCLNSPLTNVTHSTTGATGIDTPTGLPAGVSASWAGNIITISGTPAVSGVFAYTIPLTGGCGTVSATGTITVNAPTPVSLSYAGGIFCPAFNSVPPTNSWTGSGAYSVTPVGLGLNTGTGLIALNSSLSGVYTVTYAPVGCALTANSTVTISDVLDFANLQFPANGTICQTGTFDAYGQVYNDGLITTVPGGQAAGITVQIGYSSIDSVPPAVWTNWINASFNAQVGNNDEYKGTLSGLAPGIYYYTFRYQINGCAWQYGGYNAGGGGFWNGTTANSGVLTVTASNNAGSDAAVTVCATGNAINLFNSLGGGPSTTGTWTGPSSLGGGYLGNFNPLTQPAGTYTYNVSGGSCPADESTVTVTISNSPTAVITYPSPVCTNVSTVVNPNVSGTTGGIFSANPAGITLTNGGFIPSATTPGTYTITYSIAAAGGCSAFNTQTTVVVSAPPAIPVLSPNPVCSGASAVFTATGGSWYEFFLNGSSVAPASASNNWTSGAINGGNVVCVRSYSPVALTNNGSIENQWGTPIATNTGGPASGFGQNYINALYLSTGGGYLYGAIAGSLVNGSNNRILLFLDCIPGGYNNLNGVNLTGSPYVSVENLNPGITFDPGFSADFIVCMNVAGGIAYYDLFNLQTNTNYYIGSNTGAAGIVPNSLLGYSSASGPSDFSSGFEFAIPNSLIGNPAGSISTFTMLVNDPGLGNATNTTLSNQFLSPAASGDGNYGNGAVFFGSAAPNPVAYSLPLPCFTESCVTVTNSVNPVFTDPPAICQGGIAPEFPSTGGVTGTWNPAVISNQSTATYNFIPTSACGGGGSITVTVNPLPGSTLIFHD